MNNAWLEAIRIFVAYVLPVAIAAGSAVMFFRVLRRLEQLETRIADVEKGLSYETSVRAKEVSALRKEMAAEAISKPSSLSSGGSSTLRAKALKMHRLGHSVEQISKALSLPKSNLNLLLKVNAMVLQPFEQNDDEENFEDVASSGTKVSVSPESGFRRAPRVDPASKILNGPVG